jgi:hypothetical protein
MALEYPWKLILGYKLNLTTLPNEVVPLKVYAPSSGQILSEVAAAFGCVNQITSDLYRSPTKSTFGFTKTYIATETLTGITSYSALVNAVALFESTFSIDYSAFGARGACVNNAKPTVVLAVLGLVDNTANPPGYPVGYQLRDIALADSYMVDSFGYGSLVPYYFFMAQKIDG